MNRSTPGLPVHHQLPEFSETHVHRVSDAIQPSHPLSSPSPPAPQSLPASESFPWQTDGEMMETVTDFIILGSKITANGDCSHEIKGCLLLGRKAMTNLNSLLKNRDITLPTKVHLVKAMVFLWSCMDVRVGLWRRLSAKELMLLNCGVREDSWESLGLQRDPTSPF